MASRYWVVGGEYQGADFRALIPGTETIRGPFADERRAHCEWIRLTRCPQANPAVTR